MRKMFPAYFLPLLLASAAAAASGDRITLSQFLAEARSGNLGLQEKAAAAEAAGAASAGWAIPAPMVGISRVKDMSGKASGLEISQTIPFPTRLTGDHSARSSEAQAREAERNAAALELTAEAQLLYFRLWEAQERLALLGERKSAIQDHLRLSGAAVRSDSFLKIHQLKSEGDLDLLDNEILQAEQAQKETQLRAAELLRRDPRSFHPLAEETALSEVPKEDVDAPSYQVETKRLELASLDARVTEAHSTWLPDLNLRYREMSGTSMNPRYTEAMVGISLPFVFFWEPNAASGKASGERIAAELRFEQEKLRVQSRRVALLAKAASLRKQLVQFQTKLLPKAEKRMRLVHNVAPRDMESLVDHRETMEALPELKLKALETRAAFEETIAELRKYGQGDHQ